MAGWLREMTMVPNLILSSTSHRTRETVELMIGEWGSEPVVTFTEGLYLATPEMILRTIQSDGCGAERLMVLAHNPGVTHFVSTLAKQGVEMPTAAIAIFELELDDWSKLRMGTHARLIHYMRPKAL